MRFTNIYTGTQSEKEMILIVDTCINLDIYLMIGQSNMAGRAPMDEHGKTIDGVYLLNKDDVFEPAQGSFNRYSTVEKEGMGDNLNPGNTFAKRILEVCPNARIGLVSNARGGTAITEWEKGGLLYNEAARRTKAAMRYGKIRGILWHQGESDCNESCMLSQYLERLIVLVNNIRADLGNETIPFIAGQIVAFTDTKAQFNNLMSGISERIPYSGCVSSADLTDVGDGIHFDTAAQITLGRRYADEILRLVYEMEVKMPKLTYHVTNGCTLCGMCVYECPAGAITMKKNGAIIDSEKCVGCGACEQNCASEAISKEEA